MGIETIIRANNQSNSGFCVEMTAGTVQFRKIRSNEIVITGSPSLGPNEAWTPSTERDTHNLPGQLDAFPLSLGT